MRIALFAAGGVAALLVGLGIVTWWALEAGGVAVLETQATDGSLRSTHVWFAEPAGELWLEAGTPANSWYLDVQQNPVVSFSTETLSGRYIAERVEDPSSHDVIRRLLRVKYGVRDWWIGVLFDTTRSIAVRLVPAPSPAVHRPPPARRLREQHHSRRGGDGSD